MVVAILSASLSAARWAALSDLFELLFEVARRAQPDDPHRPRLCSAFFISDIAQILMHDARCTMHDA